MAWLNTVPEKHKRPRISAYKEREKAGEEVPQLEMPELLVGEYLIEYLFEAGPVGNSGFGPETLTWLEIEAWSKLARVDLDAWEAVTLRNLSSYYAAQLARSADPSCPPPYRVATRDRTQIAQDVERYFDRLERKQKQRA